MLLTHLNRVSAQTRQLDAKRKGGDAALDALEGQLALAPYLVGDAYTIADIALYAYTHVADEAGFGGRRGWLRFQ